MSSNVGSQAQPLHRPSKRFVLEAKSAPRPSPEGLSWKIQLVVFLAGAILVISRRPDAILTPQFFGEDGSIWFPDAYMSGWLTSLTHSQNGYFQTLPRLVSALALLVPFRFAPLLMNVIGIALQVLPVNILLSARCRSWAPISVRALMGIAYIALPNTRELDAAIEEGQWHLALVACILVLAAVPSSKAWRIFDLSVIVLSGLSGPFSVLLLPVAVAFWWFRRDRWRIVVICAIAATAAIQLSAIFQNAAATRPQIGLGATPALFIKLLAGQVYLGALLGQTSAPTLFSGRVLLIAALLGTAIVVYSLLEARLEFKLFVTFAFLVFAASLRNPMVSSTVPQWQVLRDSPGIRYWFFPMLGFTWALIWCLTSSRSWGMRFLALAGSFALIVGIIRDWQYPPYTDFHFEQHAKEFEAAAPGTLAIIPIVPDGWSMRLTKKNPLCPTTPFGRIDEPARGASVGNSIPTAGWVAGDDPVQRVSILIDGRSAASATPDTVRPDVDSFYPRSPMKNKGWSTVLDTSQLTPGDHEISARAIEANGCNVEFDTVGVRRVK